MSYPPISYPVKLNHGMNFLVEFKYKQKKMHHTAHHKNPYRKYKLNKEI